MISAQRNRAICIKIWVQYILRFLPADATKRKEGDCQEKIKEEPAPPS
jgi:hypothetical protein